MSSDFSPQSINPASLRREMALEKQMRQLARQVASKEAFSESCEEGNQYIASIIDKEMKSKAKTLQERTKTDVKKEEKVFGVDESSSIGSEFDDLNPELDKKTLLILKSRILDDDSADDVLKKVLDVYSDYSLADDALDYLEKISEDTQISQVKQARKEFNENFDREIKAGKNIAEEARAFAMQGLGSPTALRDLYREITGSPREVNALFDELSDQFEFEDLKKVVKFLLNSLGKDLKSKGPSIQKGELYRLLTETRNLQSILGVFLFFQARMSIIYRSFDKYHLYYPKKMTFELIAKLFMKLLQDRYPSSVKVIKLGKELGLTDEVLAQIIVLGQCRDAVRYISPKLFKDLKHRNEVLNTFIDALEELDELLDEEEEEEDDD
jgi:type III secretion protein W